MLRGRNMAEDKPIEVEEAGGEVEATAEDRRAKMPEPLGVRLVAVGDVRLPVGAGSEGEMDGFYVKLLGLAREEGEGLVYRADNFRLCFEAIHGFITHDTYRPVQIEVLRLGETELRLIEEEVEHERTRGLTPGSESLVLRDPSGNWVEVVERREVR